MDRCRRCDRLVDTDFDLECYDKQDHCVCESCREREEMANEADYTRDPVNQPENIR